jgi:hypothetical protein
MYAITSQVNDWQRVHKPRSLYRLQFLLSLCKLTDSQRCKIALKMTWYKFGIITNGNNNSRRALVIKVSTDYGYYSTSSSYRSSSFFLSYSTYTFSKPTRRYTSCSQQKNAHVHKNRIPAPFLKSAAPSSKATHLALQLTPQYSTRRPDGSTPTFPAWSSC